MHQPKIEQMHFSVMHFAIISLYKKAVHCLWCGIVELSKMGKMGILQCDVCIEKVCKSVL